MAIFTPATIERFSKEGVFEFATRRPYVIQRTILDIVKGTRQYALPDSILSIRRVTWLGEEIIPLPSRQARDFELAQLAESVPTWFVFNNITQPAIDFYPLPSKNVLSPIAGVAPNAAELYSTLIADHVIVEFFGTPTDDPPTHPDYFHEVLDRTYIELKRAEIQTKAKDQKALEYYKERWNFLNEWYDEILTSIATQPRRVDSGFVRNKRNRIPRPRLPSGFRNL